MTYEIKKCWILFFAVLSIMHAKSQNPIKIYADPETAPPIKASKFIDSIDFIPLETTKDSKYQNYYWFIVAKDHFLMMDNATNSVFIFNKNGKFLYKHKSQKGRFKINSLQYVPSKNAVLIISYNKNYTISDNKKLQLIKKWKDRDISKYVSVEWIHLDNKIRIEKAYAPSLVLNNNVTYFDNGFIYRNYTNDKYDKDSVIYRLVQYDSTNKIKHQYFPFLNLPKMWSAYNKYVLALPVISTPKDSTMLFQIDYVPTIYELGPNSLVEKYQFVFPMSNVMPANFNSLIFNNNIDYEKYKEKNNNALAYFSSMIEHKKYLIFGYSTIGYNYKNFILIENLLYSLDKLTTDSSIHNLSPRLFRSFDRQDKDYVYTVIDPASLVSQKDNLLADTHITATFKDYLKKMTKDDNHIIIRVKLK